MYFNILTILYFDLRTERIHGQVYDEKTCHSRLEHTLIAIVVWSLFVCRVPPTI